MATRPRFVQTGTKQRGAGAAERVMSEAAFAGEIVPGARYLLVDDYLTLGSTMQNLRSAIAFGGGEVMGVATLGKTRFTASFAPQAETLAQLRAKFPGLEPDWRALTGAPSEALTDAEARYLLGFADEGALKERVLGVATGRAVVREGPLAPGAAGAPAPGAPPSAAELAEIERLRDALKAVPDTRFDAGGLTAGAVRPAADLPGYVRDVAKGEPGGRALPRFLFSLGRWPGRLREQATAFVARFGEGRCR